MTDEKIREFRNAMNCYNVIQFLKKDDKRNGWSCVCSAMDWITMAVTDLNFYPDVPSFGTNDTCVHEHALLLLRISWLKESIDQLYRFMENNHKAYLYDDKSCFHDENLSDNEYFEELRAVFAAHQINLCTKLVKDQKENERFFASWPAGNDSVFSVYLYSNMRNGIVRQVDFPYAELENYTLRRYAFLDKFQEWIEQNVTKE